LTKLRDEAHRFANFYRKQQAKIEFKTAEKKQQNQIKIQTTKNKSDFFLLSSSN
jgi:hypothetical protein